MKTLWLGDFWPKAAAAKAAAPMKTGAAMKTATATPGLSLGIVAWQDHQQRHHEKAPKGRPQFYQLHDFPPFYFFSGPGFGAWLVCTGINLIFSAPGGGVKANRLSCNCREKFQ